MRVDVMLALLVDRGVQKERQQHRSRTVDGHGYGSLRVTEVEAGVEFLGIVNGADCDACITYLAVDIGTWIRVVSVERDRIESCRQTLGWLFG